MFELIGLGIAAAAGILGHVKSRDFVRRRLRYTKAVQNPGVAGVTAGVVSALVAAPIAALLPLIGAGTALVFGAGVGTGVALGARDSGRPLPDED